MVVLWGASHLRETNRDVNTTDEFELWVFANKFSCVSIPLPQLIFYRPTKPIAGRSECEFFEGVRFFEMRPLE